MRAWIIALGLVAACKGNKDKETTPPPQVVAAAPGIAAPAVKVATVIAKDERRPPYLLLVDDAGMVRLAAARTWAELDAHTLTIAKRSTKPREVDGFIRESFELGRDPVEALAGWDDDTGIDLASLDDIANQDDPPPPPPEDMPDDGRDESGGTGTAMALDEGKMGKKDADRAEGQYKMQKNQDDPQLARQQAIEQARAAGILGSSPNGGVGGGVLGHGIPNEDGTPSRVADVAGVVAIDGKLARMRAMVVAAPTVKATTLIATVRETGAAIAVLHDGKLRPLNVDFGVYAGEGATAWVEARVSAKGIVVEAVPDKPLEAPAIAQLGTTVAKAREARGIDADAPVDVLVDPDVDAQRLVDVLVALDVAGVQVIGMGGAPSADELARRGHRIPITRFGQPNAQGDLDKKEIRKVVKGAKTKITYCYEKALVTSPALAGTVQTQFFITPTGAVASVAASGVSPEVADCVAKVIKSLTFPKPKGGGGVQVNYPFSMHQ